MKYIVHQRFKDIAICGHVNLPAFTECESCDGLIMYKGKPLCYEFSENAHQYFAENEDGDGIKRGNLTQSIQKVLSKHDPWYQERWNKIWEDSICQRYKRPEYDNHWLWNHDFFHASLEDLQYIAKLIEAKECV